MVGDGWLNEPMMVTSDQIIDVVICVVTFDLKLLFLCHHFYEATTTS